MTGPTSAASSASADAALNNLYSKAPSQGADAGEFAKALTDADTDADDVVEPGDTPDQEGEASEALVRTDAGRFKSLSSLDTLIKQSADLSKAQGETAPAARSPLAQEALSVSEATVDNTADLQPIPLNIGMKDDAVAGGLQATEALNTDADAAGLSSASLDLASLPLSTLQHTDKATSETLSVSEATVGNMADLQPIPVNTGIKDDVVAGGLQATGELGNDADAAVLNSASLDLALLTLALSSPKRTDKAVSETCELDSQLQANVDTDADDPVTADATIASAEGAALNPFSAEALLQLTGADAGATTVQGTDGQDSLTIGAAIIDGPLSKAETDDAQDPLAGAGMTDPEADAVGDAKPFRLQKAGDAATAVGLSLVRGADGSAELQDAAAPAGAAETVTVLDSRRYLGFGLGTNASHLMATVANDKDWAAAMQPLSSLSEPSSAAGTGNVVNTLRLELTPENLGSVTAKMRLVGDELSIHLTVHSALAYRELSADSKPMLEALRSQGFSVDQVTISMAPVADTSSSNSSDQQQQAGGSAQSQQQPARDGEASRQQPQRQERAANNEPRLGMESRHEIAAENGRTGLTGSGDIYL